MDSLQRQKFLRGLAIVVAVGGVAAMLGWHVWRPADPAADAISEVTDDIVGQDWDEASPEQREAMRQRVEALPPETRREIFTNVARARIDDMRDRFDKLSPDERRVEVDTMRDRMRRQREKMTPEERQRVRDRIMSPEGAEMLKHAMEIYSQEFTARERAELDPLMHEWFLSLQEIMRQ